MDRRARRWWAAAAAAALVLTACSGSGGDDASGGDGAAGEAGGATTTTVAETTTAPATTAPAETTTAPPATTAPAQTPPADLTDDEIKAEVIKGYELYLSGVAACGADPENCNPDDYAVPGSVASDSLASFAFSLVDQGLRGTPNPAVDRYVIERLEVDSGAKSVEVWTCTVDGAVVRDLQGAVVNDAVGTVRTQWTFVPGSEGWRVQSGAVLDDEDGDQCPAS